MDNFVFQLTQWWILTRINHAPVKFEYTIIFKLAEPEIITCSPTICLHYSERSIIKFMLGHIQAN